LLEVLNAPIKIDNEEQTLSNAIKIYCRSIFLALKEKDISLIKYYEL